MIRSLILTTFLFSAQVSNADASNTFSNYGEN